VFYVLGGPFIELEFRIYNKWGELIFVSTDQSVGWNGTYDGVPQPAGVYVYTVHAITPDSATHYLEGDVTLVR
jgi:gliding motility-associated-like protein